MQEAGATVEACDCEGRVLAMVECTAGELVICELTVEQPERPAAFTVKIPFAGNLDVADVTSDVFGVPVF